MPPSAPFEQAALPDREGRPTALIVWPERRRFRDAYHRLLQVRWRVFFAVLTAAYLTVNVTFALGYLACGDGVENARPGSFTDAFFFSVQTLSTIGYGKMTPRSVPANLLVALEALVGMVAVAMAAGLAFARLARPTARVMFSRNAVVVERNGVPSLMFRVANERANQVLEASMRVVLTRDERTLEGEPVRRFYDLALARASSAVFALSWTAIHPITEDSPLRGVTAATLAACNAQIVVTVNGYDETIGQTVHARHTYLAHEVLWGARLADILTRLPDGRTRVDYTRFHDVLPPGGGPA